MCALHPGIGQRVLYTLVSLPSSLVWMALLLLLWRVIRAARQTGPFTVQAAVAMRRLGWLIIAGTAVATAVQGFALDQLLNTMLTPPNSYGDALLEAFHALLPVPDPGRGGPAHLRAHHPARRRDGRRDQGDCVTRQRADAAGQDDEAAGEAAFIRVRLDEMLSKRGMTLTELSARVNVTVVNLSILKNGRARAIRFSTLARLCAALHCQPGDLLSYEPPAAPAAAPEGTSVFEVSGP